MRDKIGGVIYGMAIGDAMGMPSELWNKNQVKNYFKTKITTFLPGPAENPVACYYQAGQYTDDTAQALVILDTLIANNFIANKTQIGIGLLNWAVANDAFQQNILGPSSKAALQAIKDQQDAKIYTDKALSNGSAMRIAPIGCLFAPHQMHELIEFVSEISAPTHTSDICITGAGMIAYVISSAIYNYQWSEIITGLKQIEQIGLAYGEPTFSPSLFKRTQLGIEIAKQYHNQDELFINELYDVIGAGVNISESVPNAIALAYYATSVEHAAILAANMGGDTDTIGAMACAIMGGFSGKNAIEKNWINIICQANQQTNFEQYIDQITNYQNRK